MSTTKPPFLNGTNYAYWKVTMIAFLRAINDQVWDIVVEGYFDPTVFVEGKLRLKPKVQWTNAERTKSNCNNKALNAIYNVVTQAELHRIFGCPNAKAAWDLLTTAHEGTNTVKQITLQNSTTAFETIRMKDSETFDKFKF